MCQYPYFVCPIEYSETLDRMTMECEPSVLFRPTEYSLPSWLSGLLGVVSPNFLIWTKLLTFFVVWSIEDYLSLSFRTTFTVFVAL